MMRSLVIFFLLPLVASAANVYVRDGGSGAGTSWSDALDQIPATLTRGDTIYVADGAYTAPTLDDAVSSTSVITIKKATASDHGTETGWDAAYGDGVADFTGTWLIHTGYHTIDGQVGGGPGSWQSGHGFKFDTVQIIDSSFDVNTAIPGGNIELHHIEFQGTLTPSTDDAISANSLTGFVISHCYTYDTDNCPVNLFLCDTITWQYSCHGEFASSEEHHAEIVFFYGSGNADIRWNLFRWAESTGGIMMNTNGDPVRVYGNIFYRASGETWSYGGDGLVGTWTNRADLTFSNAYIINNTFVNIPSDAAGLIGTTPGSNRQWTNNYFYSSDTGLPNALWTHDYNQYQDSGSESEANGTTGTGDPFVDYVNLDFNLTANTTAGTDLGSPYNVDMYGNTRTTWTRGAIEYDGSPPSGGSPANGNPASTSFITLE